MTFTTGAVLVGLKGTGTASDKYVIKCGFRPAMIQWWIMDSSDKVSSRGIWLDGVGDSDGTSATKGYEIDTSAAYQLVGLGTAGMTALEDGFELGSGAIWTSANRKWFLVHRTTYPIVDFDISSVPKLEHEYGSGGAFKVDGFSGDTVEVFKR